jgi:putative ATP-binding cassette transporter
MKLLHLLGRFDPGLLRRLVWLAAASAVTSTLVLAIVNRAAQDIAETKADFVHLGWMALFTAAVTLYALAETRMVADMSDAVETAIDRLRLTLVGQVRHADLSKLERFGRAPLFESITRTTQTISQNSSYLVLTLRSLIMTATIMIYIAIISPLAFLLIALVLGWGTRVYLKLGRALDLRQKALMAEEEALFESVADLFDGFKEQRLNSHRSRGLNDTFADVSGRTTAARDQVHMHTWQQFVFGETAFNLMLGLVVFVVPTYSASVGSQLAQVSAAVFFLAGPVFGLMQSLAVMRAAEAAAARMLELEEQLTHLAEIGADRPAEPVPADFSEIVLEGMEYVFPTPEGEPAFAVGPFDLTLRRGETVFVTGGNGSGKSTFIKLLTGLYHPLRGRLAVDGVTVGPARLAAYRETMATVFADFHLFTHLYGLDEPDPEEAGTLMRWMEMERVAGIEDGRFTRRDLSAGQRKRLGLVAALLEKKPVLVLDEWAADQDPHFRHTFYREVVPALKRRGVTIVAVTHDDHYFDVADRRLHMDEGRLSELPAAAGGVA